MHELDGTASIQSSVKFGNFTVIVTIGLSALIAFTISKPILIFNKRAEIMAVLDEKWTNDRQIFSMPLFLAHCTSLYACSSTVATCRLTLGLLNISALDTRRGHFVARQSMLHPRYCLTKVTTFPPTFGLLESSLMNCWLEGTEINSALVDFLSIWFDIFDMKSLFLVSDPLSQNACVCRSCTCRSDVSDLCVTTTVNIVTRVCSDAGHKIQMDTHHCEVSP